MKEKFQEVYSTKITRPGADKLLTWLDTTDFYTAPASTKYHLSEPGGLVKHSVHVYQRLRNLYIVEQERKGCEDINESEEESIAICGLLHDVCKIGLYHVETRNKKNADGRWEQVPFYTYKDSMPYGHGEKSVYMISGFMKLTREEAMAIRWHMGFTTPEFKGGSYTIGDAFNMYPLAVLTHVADLEATYLDEAPSR